MNNTEQVRVISEALELEKKIEGLETKRDFLEVEEYPDPPQEPHYEKVERTYPEVKSTLKYWKVIALWYGAMLVCFVLGSFIDVFLKIAFAIGGLSTVFLIGFYFLAFRKMKAANIEKIRNSEAYKAECKKLNDEYDAQDAKNLKDYQDYKEQYETKLMPEYTANKANFAKEKQEKLAEYEEQISANKEALEELYTTSKIVPKQYHEVAALQYFYDLMSTSEYDIKEAIAHFEENKERVRAEAHRRQVERLQEEQAMAAAAAAETAELARRDANRAALVGAVQRHNTNKQLKKMNNFFDKK